MVGKPRKVSLYSVKLKDPQTAQKMVDKINAMYPDDISAALSGEFAEQMPDMQNVNAMLDGISFLAILVGGLGMMNTMLMAVLERTREIGVLRALGWRRRAVLRMIMDESLLLSTLGGVGGIMIAFLLNGAISMAGMMGEMFQAQWTVGLFIRALMIAFLLGGLGGLYPAYRATRLQPVEAIRYE
jgi:putative ABC transport system permease protein